MIKMINDKLKYYPILLIIFFTIFNLVLFSLTRKHQSNLSLEEFIKKNANKELESLSEYNLFFFVSPFDCEVCSEYLLDKKFIDNLKRLLQKKQRSFSISFVITGDYTENEKIEYILKIQDIISYYIDKNNNAKKYLKTKFGTSRTPFLLISDFDGETIYWQHFKLKANELNYSTPYEKLLAILEIIL